MSICESYYHPERKGTAHKTYKSLGSVETWRERGLSDPVAYFQKEVDELNRKRTAAAPRMISEIPSTRCLGYFPLKAMMEKMQIRKYVGYFTHTGAVACDLYDLLASLIFARAVTPCGAPRPFHEVLPALAEPLGLPYGQLLNGLAFLGNDYGKFVEIFTVQTRRLFGADAASACYSGHVDLFLDSGENPHITLELQLDRNRIPVGLRFGPPGTPGDGSGKTVRVSNRMPGTDVRDVSAVQRGDGYLFVMPYGRSDAETAETAADRIRNAEWKDIRDRRGRLLFRCASLQSAKAEKRLLLYNPEQAARRRSEINRAAEEAKFQRVLALAGGADTPAPVDRRAVTRDLQMAGYSLLITSETDMRDAELCTVYRDLQQIGDAFQAMRAELDARPAFAEKEVTVRGYLLIGYLTLLLTRLLGRYVLQDACAEDEIFRFMRSFRIIEGEFKYINATSSGSVVRELASVWKLPLLHYYLTERQLRQILHFRL